MQFKDRIRLNELKESQKAIESEIVKITFSKKLGKTYNLILKDLLRYLARLECEKEADICRVANNLRRKLNDNLQLSGECYTFCEYCTCIKYLQQMGYLIPFSYILVDDKTYDFLVEYEGDNNANNNETNNA
ncbi:MAG: hypothetical protein J6A59_13295 [Lachnospiraceae bacterium]|nr:hypothetical protein [Lachnospiraceae bacterium]